MPKPKDNEDLWDIDAKEKKRSDFIGDVMLKDTYVTHCNCCPLKFDRGSLQDLNREKLRQGNQKVFELNADQDKEWFGRS